MNIETLIFIIIAYFFGSLSSAIIICKLLKLPDPRTEGSKNPGTTNVLRIGGKSAAFATLVGDILKGTIPVLMARAFALSPFGLSAVALAAFLGHVFPIFFDFKGGKGVATAFGCLLALSWPVGLSVVFTWLIIATITRYSSLAALITAVLSPVYALLWTGQLLYGLAALLMALMLIYRHKSNIQKLLQGQETKIGQK
jgi:acyl phosphate:glycerol-3-phosphate acyltransferase